MADLELPSEPAPPRPKRKPAPAVESIIYLDYLGEPDAEGNRQPGHKLATLVAGAKGSSSSSGPTPLPQIIVRPGLNIVLASTWKAHCPEVSAPKEKEKAGKFLKLVLGEHLIVLDELPDSAAQLVDMASRTHCPKALEALAKHEHDRKGGGGKRSRPRVTAAIAGRIAVVKRRLEHPRAPGPRLRGTSAA